MFEHPEEEWRIIPEFPRYEVNAIGQLRLEHNGRPMRTSVNQFGHAKISLVNEYGRFDRSVATLVAEAFVKPDNVACVDVIVLDGDFTNLRYDNLMWRPTHIAWKYTRQLKVQQPAYYWSLPVLDVVNNVLYESIAQAGMSNGLLFDDIWYSTYTRTEVWPTRSIFEVQNRV